MRSSRMSLNRRSSVTIGTAQSGNNRRGRQRMRKPVSFAVLSHADQSPPIRSFPGNVYGAISRSLREAQQEISSYDVSGSWHRL